MDYARGDGRVCGPGGDPWTAVVIDDDTGWVRDFRGLWGHDTRDRLGGERGPAGPRYERDGTVRKSWADPVGWAGMAKVAPNPAVEAQLVRARVGELDDRLAALDAERAACRHTLATAAAGLAPSSPEVRSLAPEEARVLRLAMEATRLRDERVRMVQALDDPPVQGGPTRPPAASAHPAAAGQRCAARALSGWAVVSSPVLLFAVGVVCMPSFGVNSSAIAGIWIVLLLSIEGLLRAKLVSVLLRMAVAAVLLVGLYYLVTDVRVVLAWAVLRGRRPAARRQPARRVAALSVTLSGCAVATGHRAKPTRCARACPRSPPTRGPGYARCAARDPRSTTGLGGPDEESTARPRRTPRPPPRLT